VALGGGGIVAIVYLVMAMAIWLAFRRLSATAEESPRGGA
jgi:hypothetical protein